MVPVMAETPDTAALARRWLDLWEDELAAFAADPQLAGQLAGLLAAFARFAAPAAPGDGATAPARPATAGPASGDGAGGVDQLARRLGAVERRLAVLERAGRPARKRSPARPAAAAKKRKKPARK